MIRTASGHRKGSIAAIRASRLNDASAPNRKSRTSESDETPSRLGQALQG